MKHARQWISAICLIFGAGGFYGMVAMMALRSLSDISEVNAYIFAFAPTFLGFCGYYANDLMKNSRNGVPSIFLQKERSRLQSFAMISIFIILIIVLAAVWLPHI